MQWPTLKTILATCLTVRAVAFAPHLSTRHTVASRFQQNAWLERWWGRRGRNAAEETKPRQLSGFFYPDDSLIVPGRPQATGYFPAGPPSRAWRWRARASLAGRFLLLKVRQSTVLSTLDNMHG
jgi:hypothetical protein